MSEIVDFIHECFDHMFDENGDMKPEFCQRSSVNLWPDREDLEEFSLPKKKRRKFQMNYCPADKTSCVACDMECPYRKQESQ